VGSDSEPGRRQWRDLLLWALLALLGIGICLLTLVAHARVGTSSPPFLGEYAVRLSPATPVAIVVAAAVLLLAHRGVFERVPWRVLLTLSYLGTLAWTVSLALRNGLAGITAPLHDRNGPAADVPGIGDDPYAWLHLFTAETASHSWHSRGHPPGPVLLLWSTQRIGLTDDVSLGLLLAAGGALAVPLVLTALRNACGDLTARRYLPVLVLAPYGLWALHPDVLAATLGAAMIVTGAWATRHRGWPAAIGGVGSGLLLGTAAMFAYAAAWLGLSVILLYFARRRPLLNVLTGIGALVPILVAQALGFNWVEGLVAAELDYAVRVEPYRSALWWAALSLVALLLVTGPALIASLRKLRNTPAWPFLVGAGAAILFSVLAGFARGGIEHSWLAFFPWLTIAAVAPERQGGTPVPTPLLLTAAGALTAVAISVALVT